MSFLFLRLFTFLIGWYKDDAELLTGMLRDKTLKIIDLCDIPIMTEKVNPSLV